MTARLSTSMYVNIKYSDIEPQYQHADYSPQFGNYIVSFRDKDGGTFSREVSPKVIPIIVIYDSLDPGP